MLMVSASQTQHFPVFSVFCTEPAGNNSSDDVELIFENESRVAESNESS